MLKHSWLAWLVGVWLMNAAPVQADLILSVGDVELRPNMANQEIPVYGLFRNSTAASIATAGGLQLNVRIGDGTGAPGTAPVFEGARDGDSLRGISFEGTIWEGASVDTTPDPLPGFSQYASAGIGFVSNSNFRTFTAADQVVARLFIDTTGVESGIFAIVLDDANITPSYFLSASDDVLSDSTYFQNGSFHVNAVPEPGALWALAMSSLVGIFSRRRCQS